MNFTTNPFDTEYLTLMQEILRKGVEKSDRTGTGTRSVFGKMLEFDMSTGKFPLLTTKKVYFKGVAHELLWFLKGSTNIKYLVENNVHIWTDNAYDYFKKVWIHSNASESPAPSKEYFLKRVLDKPETRLLHPKTNEKYTYGDLGNVYGAQWRNWRGYEEKVMTGNGYESRKTYFDQIHAVCYNLVNNPDSRRHIVSSWNVAEIGEMALPPCHTMFQFFSEPQENGKRKLSLLYTIRSNDYFLGAPFNIASYALLLHMVAQVTNHSVGTLKTSIGDAHIYLNHIGQSKQQLENGLSDIQYESPSIWLNPEIKHINDFTYNDVKTIDYKSHPNISAPMAV